MLVISGI